MDPIDTDTNEQGYAATVFVGAITNKGVQQIELILLPSGDAISLNREQTRQLINAMQGLLNLRIPSRLGETHEE